MPIVLKSIAGLFAGAMVGLLTMAFWPRIEPAVVNARPAVERPTFVTGALAKTAEAAKAAAPATDKAAIEKLALALRGSTAGGEDASTSPAAASLASASLETNGKDKALRLRAQGLVALADGDVAGARAFLERAAEAGDARALLVLGDTYDPAMLARMGAVGLKGDPSRARDYYARALSAGAVRAGDRIAYRDAQ